MVSAAFADRPQKKLVLFDVDGTLSLARKVRRVAHGSSLPAHPNLNVADRHSRDDCTASRAAQKGGDRRCRRFRLRQGRGAGHSPRIA